VGRKAKATTMKDPAPRVSPSDLASVLRQINEESDALNASILEFEKQLIAMNPGFEVWVPSPFLVSDPDEPHTRGSQLGFAKFGRSWALVVRKVVFERHEPSGLHKKPTWTLLGDGEGEYARLMEATREERVAALDHFEFLVEQMHSEALVRLESLREANAKQQMLQGASDA
jgi:hypothetical protein